MANTIPKLDSSLSAALVDSVVAHAKDYEFISLASNTLMERSISRVKNFIRENGCIVYGGTAIDYALRLRGDKIYSDAAQRIPDLDFYSPTHVQSAYKLADILYADGNKSSRAIVAIHVETMRVDVGDNNFIADISYVPGELFDVLPILEYDDMRILHPIYQRLDIHSSLSFPYDEPPREVVFHRWKKDVERFNKLDAAYPIAETLAGESKKIPSHSTKPGGNSSGRIVRAPILARHVIHGFAAFAAYVEMFRQLKLVVPTDIAGDPLFAESMINVESNTLIFSSPIDAYELVDVYIDNIGGYYGIDRTAMEYFNPFVNITPELCKFHMGVVDEDGAFVGDENLQYIVHSCAGKMLSVSTIHIGGMNLRISCIQYVMKYMLGMYFLSRADIPDTAYSDLLLAPEVYLRAYNVLLEITKTITDALAFGEITELEAEPFMLKVKVYGKENVSASRELQLNSIYADFGREERLRKPMGYYPAKSHSLEGEPEWPKVDLTLPIYSVSGKKISPADSPEVENVGAT